MIFTIPVSVVGDQGTSQLTVELPLNHFKETYLINSNEIVFEANVSRKPQKICLTYQSNVENNCIIFQPIVESGSVKNAPLRTISLKKNNVEVAVPIDNLSQQWNYKSWSNPWLSNGDTIVYRYYWDYEAVRDTQS